MNRSFVMSPLIVVDSSGSVKLVVVEPSALAEVLITFVALGDAAVTAAVMEQWGVAGLDAHLAHPAEHEHVVTGLFDPFDVTVDKGNRSHEHRVPRRRRMPPDAVELVGLAHRET